MVANIDIDKQPGFAPDPWGVNRDMYENPRHPGRLADEARAAQVVGNIVGVDMASELLGHDTSAHDVEPESTVTT